MDDAEQEKIKMVRVDGKDKVMVQENEDGMTHKKNGGKQRLLKDDGEKEKPKGKEINSDEYKLKLGKDEPFKINRQMRS